MTLEERLNTFLEKTPNIHANTYIAAASTIIGDVRIENEASIWPQAVLRGDINYIHVGEGSNIQDGAIIHVADDFPAILGKHVTVGHAAIVHACHVEDNCLIGMHATIMDGAVIGKNSIIGAGCLVKQGMIIPERSLVMGLPGKVVRTLSNEEVQSIEHSALKYIGVSKAHKALKKAPTVK